MVGKVEIIITPQVIVFLDDLVRILYKKEYFGFIESAEEYVSKIYDSINENIRLSPYKTTPHKLKYLGSKYIFYKANSRTTWFFFFENSNNNYLITGILNNHCEEVKDL